MAEGTIFIAIATSIIISVIVYYLLRFFDKSSQQLSKLKLFVNKSISDIDTFVIEKKQNIKDLSIDIDFNIKKGESLFKKNEKFAADISLFFSKFEEQRKEIDDLKRSIAQIEALRQGITGEIDRITNDLGRIDQYKKDIKSLGDKFGDMNDEILHKQVALQEQMEAYLVELHEKANKVINENARLQYEKIRQTDSELAKGIETSKKEMNEKLASLVNAANASIREVQGGFEARLAKMNNLFAEWDVKLDARKDDSAKLADSLFTELKQRFAQVQEEQAQYVRENIKNIESVKSQINILYMELDEKVNMFGQVIASEYSDLEGVYKEKLDSIAENKIKDLEDLLAKGGTQYEALIQKSEKFQADIDEIVSNRINDVGKYIVRIENRIDSYKDSVFNDIEKRFSTLDLDAKAIMEQHRNGLENLSVQELEKVRGQYDDLKEKVDRMNEAVSSVNDNYVSNYEKILLGLKQNLVEKENTLFAGIKIDFEKREHDLTAASEKLEKGVVQLNELIETKITEAKGVIGREIDKLLTDTADKKEKMAAIKGQVDGELKALTDEVERTVALHGNKINNHVEERVSVIYQTVDAQKKEVDEYIGRMKEELGSRVQDLEQHVTLHSNDFQSLLSDLSRRKSELETAVETYKLSIGDKIKGSTEAIEARIEQTVAGWKNQYAQVLETAKTEYQQKLSDFEAEIEARLTEGQLAINTMRDEKKGMVKELEDFKTFIGENVKKAADSIDGRIEQAVKDWGTLNAQMLETAKTEYLQKLTDFEAEITTRLTEAQSTINTIGEEKKGLVRDLEEYKAGIGENIKNATDSINSRIEQSVAGWGTQHAQILESTKAEYQKKMADFEAEIKARLTEGQMTINAIRDEKKALVKDLEDFKAVVEENVRKTASVIDSQIEQTVKDWGTHNAKILETAKAEYLQKLSDFEAEIEQRITEGQSSINIIRDEKKGVVKEFEEFRSIVETRMKEGNEKLDGSMAEYAKLIDQYRLKVNELESGVVQKATDIFAEKEKGWREKISYWDKRFSEIEQGNSAALKNLEQRIESDKSELTALAGMLEKDVQSLVASSEEKVIQLKVELDKIIEREKDYIQGRIPSLYDSLTALEEKYASQKAEISELQEGTQKVSRELIAGFKTQIETEIATLTRQLSPLRKELGEIRDNYEQMQKEFALIANDQKTEIEQKYKKVQTELQDRVTELTASIGKVETDYRDMIREKTTVLEKQYALFSDEVKKVRDQKLEGMEATIDRALDESKERLSEQINGYARDIESLNGSMKGTARELENQLGMLQAKITQLEEEMDNTTKSYSQDIEKSQKEAHSQLLSMSEKMSEIRDRLINDFTAKVDEKLGTITEVMERRTSDIATLHETRYVKLVEAEKELEQRINSLHGSIDKAFQEYIREKYTDITDSINKAKDTVRIAVESVLKNKDILLDQFKTDLNGIRDDVREFQKEQTSSFESKGEVYEGRIRELEKLLQMLEDKTQLIEVSKKNMQTIDMQLNDVTGKIDILSAKQKEIEQFIKEFDTVDKDIEEFSRKILELRNDRKTLAKMEETFERLIMISKKAENQYLKIDNELSTLDGIKTRFGELDGMFEKISDKFGTLKQHDIKLTELNDNIKKLDSLINMLSGKSNDIKEDIITVQSEANELNGKFISLEKEYTAIQRESQKMDLVLDKFSQMDNFISDLEERNKQLEQKKTWMLKTESRLETLGQNASELIDKLELLVEKGNTVNAMRATAKSQAGTGGGGDGDKNATVLELYKQNWSSEEIAKVTGKSGGEVDLIIQLYGKKK